MQRSYQSEKTGAGLSAYNVVSAYRQTRSPTRRCEARVKRRIQRIHNAKSVRKTYRQDFALPRRSQIIGTTTKCLDQHIGEWASSLNKSGYSFRTNSKTTPLHHLVFGVIHAFDLSSLVNGISGRSSSSRTASSTSLGPLSALPTRRPPHDCS